MLKARVKDYNLPPPPGHCRVSFGCSAQPTAYAAAVVSRVLSYQLTYFLCSQPLGPVYKPLPAEDVENRAWKIARRKKRERENTGEKCGCFVADKLGLSKQQTAHRRINNTTLLT